MSRTRTGYRKEDNLSISYTLDVAWGGTINLDSRYFGIERFLTIHAPL